MSSAASNLLPSSQRPVPLLMRADLKIERIPYQKASSWVIKDPITLKYYRFQPEQYRILELLDGQRNLEQIRDEFHRDFPAANLTLEEIQSLISDLYRSGLAYSNRLGQGAALLKQKREQMVKKLLGTLRNILYLRVPGWDPERTLTFLHPYFQWMFSPFGVVLAVGTALAAGGLLAVQFDEFQHRLPEFRQFFGWPNLLYMWLVLGAAKIIHEFGHGLTCNHFGGECHEMGVMLLVFSPCLYCDVSDSWMLKNKWKRIMIGAAGMYIEIWLSSLAIFAWWFTQPGLVHHLCLNLFFVSTVTTVIFNANPLMRYDGYYMLADWLEIPNLRPKADRLMRETFAWYCLGIEARPDPFMPQRGKGWFILFAIASAIYRWFILFAITLFFYTFLKPYGLQSIGVAMAVVSVVSIAASLVYTVYQLISTPRRDPMSTRKVSVSLVLLALLVGAGLMIPFPWSLEAALVIEPHDVQSVYVVTPGRLVSLHVKPGQTVKRGDLLAKLTNFEKEQEYRRLQREAAVQKIEIELQHSLQERAREKLAREKLQTIEEQLADYADQLAKLTIVAPCDGVVVSPPRTPEPKLDPMRAKLPRWHGTPLSPRNRDCFLEPRTHLLSIAPDGKFQAVLLVDQADRNDLSEGQKVRLKLDHLPERTFKGKIADISIRHVDFAPRELSNKYEGDVPTVTDPEGREKLTSPAYQASVVLDEDVDLFRSGFRGRAKFVVAHRSAGDWLARYLRRTFHFRL